MIAAKLVNGLLLAASFVAMYALVGSGQQWDPVVISAGQWAQHFPPGPLELPLWLVKQHTGNMFAYPNGGRDFGCAATTLLVIAGSIALWRRGRKSLVLLLLSSLPVMFLAAVVHKYPYGGSARTNMHLAAPICLLAGAGLVALLRWRLSLRKTSVGVRAAALLMIAVAAAGIVRDVASPYKKISDAENREMVRWLDERTDRADRWVVFGRFGECGHAPDLYKWGGSAARMRYYIMLHARVSVLWAPEVDRLDEEHEGRTWLIVYRDNHLPFPEDEWKEYLEGATARLGEPRVHTFPFGRDVEGAEVLEFIGS